MSQGLGFGACWILGEKGRGMGEREEENKKEEDDRVKIGVANALRML